MGLISLKERREKTASAGGVLLKITILLIALQDNGQGAATPALASIGAAFPLVGYQLVSMVATIPALMEAVVPVFYPAMVKIVRKRSVLIFCVLLYLIGGVGPAIFNTNIYLILFFRFLLGVGTGIFSVMCPDLVVDFFEGSQRSKMIGFSAAFTGISGVVFQMLGGWLAGIHWSYCFFAYLISVACLMVPVLLLPEPKRKEKIEQEKELLGAENVKTKLPGKVWIMSIFLFVYFMMFYTIITNGSGIILNEGIGTSGQIGLAFSCLSAGQVVTSVVFGWFVLKLGYRFIMPIGMAVASVSMFITCSAQSIFGFFLGLLCLGFASGMVVPAFFNKCTSLVPYVAGNKALCSQLFMMGVGGFVSPFIFNNLGLAPREQIFVGGIVYAIMILAIIVANHFIRTKDDVAARKEK